MVLSVSANVFSLFRGPESARAPAVPVPVRQVR